MKLVQIKNNEGAVVVTEVTNRNSNKEYIVEYRIRSHKGEGWKRYTYKTIESAMKKYNKVAKEMVLEYMAV